MTADPSVTEQVAEVDQRIAQTIDRRCGGHMGAESWLPLAREILAELDSLGLTPQGATEPREGGCGVCLLCDPPKGWASRMYVCATCGNKRCPCAGDCLAWECSGSNDPDQVPVAKGGRDV